MDVIKRYSLGILLGIFGFISLLSFVMYLYKFGNNGLSKETGNWGVFGDYIGGVIGTILSIASVVLIYKTYKSQIDSSSRQQFETTFFNLLQTYRQSVERLNERRNEDIREKYNKEHPSRQYADLKNKDFFDVIYAILDKEYKKFIGQFDGEPEISVFQKINPFFLNHYWMIGNYVRNFVSIIEFVDRQKIKQKEFYTNILRDMASIDELRLIYYATIWKKDEDGPKWKRLFNKYEIFDFIGNNKEDQKLIEPQKDQIAYAEI